MKCPIAAAGMAIKAPTTTKIAMVHRLRLDRVLEFLVICSPKLFLPRGYNASQGLDSDSTAPTSRQCASRQFFFGGKAASPGPSFPAGRRCNPTMVRMNSIRKACYASAVALVLGASPLVLALPAAADPCGPAGLLPAKFCPAPPTPGPPSASPTPSPTVPGNSAPPPSGAVPPQAPPKSRRQRRPRGSPLQPAQAPGAADVGPSSNSGPRQRGPPATASVPAAHDGDLRASSGGRRAGTTQRSSRWAPRPAKVIRDRTGSSASPDPCWR